MQIFSDVGQAVSEIRPSKEWKKALLDFITNWILSLIGFYHILDFITYWILSHIGFYHIFSYGEVVIQRGHNDPVQQHQRIRSRCLRLEVDLACV